MADLGGELGRVCAFLGVPFSAAMLDYHRDTTYGPPDPKLAEQWRRQAARREVALIEGKCGDLIAARGYAKGPAPHRPGRLELASLALAQQPRAAAGEPAPLRPAAARRRQALGLGRRHRAAPALPPADGRQDRREPEVSDG